MIGFKKLQLCTGGGLLIAAGAAVGLTMVTLGAAGPAQTADPNGEVPQELTWQAGPSNDGGVASSPQTCPPNTMYGQDPHQPADAWTFGTSDTGPAEQYNRFESFPVPAEPICDIHWWGADLVYPWAECDEDPMPFIITFYNDDGNGMPDQANPVCVYNVSVIGKPGTPGDYAGFVTQKYYSVDLNPLGCCSGFTTATGWVSIQGQDQGEGCWFLWLSSPMGDGMSVFYDGAGKVVEAFDLSLCLTGEPDPCKDFTVNAPGFWQGTTCGAGNDCDLRASEEHVYSVWLPNGGDWHFSLCGSVFDTYMYLTSDCCTTVVASNDDSCGLQSEIKYTTEGPQWIWVVIEAFGTTSCGEYMLEIFKWTGGCDKGNDTCATPVVIPDLPYKNVGSTVMCVDDYDEVCPYTGSTSPDVVYSYTPAADETVDIRLCQDGAPTDYDTKLYVYENICPNPGLPYACVDDACPAFPIPYVSEILGLNLTAGNTYYIIVDGYGGASGTYDLHMERVADCEIVCDPDKILEGEPVCGPDYDDTYNGGCNSTIPIFQPINCGDRICGESGVFDFGGIPDYYRDTDWYELVVTEPTKTITWNVIAEFNVLIFIIDAGSGNCVDYTILADTTAGPCVKAELTATVGPGTYWLWVGPSTWDPLPCGAKYNAELTCVWEPTEKKIDIEIFTDNYPSETTWDLVNKTTGAVVASGGPLALPGTLYTWNVPINDTDCYNFTIYDAFGDGICCLYGIGYYNVYHDGVLVCTGGEFGASETCPNIGWGCGAGPKCLIQPPNQANGLFSDHDCDICAGAQYIAENFVLDQEDSIDAIRFWGGYYPGNNPLTPDCFNVIFFLNDPATNLPGDKINVLTCVDATTRVATGVILFGVDEYEYTLDLVPNKTLGPGTYWVGITNDTTDDPTGDDWFWETGNLDPIHGIPGAAWNPDSKNGPWMADPNDLSLEIICKEHVECPWDLNGDGEIGPADLAIVLTNWGPCAPPCPADFNGDGDVGPADLAKLLTNWGPCQ